MNISFCIYEYDKNDELLITYIYPNISKELKTIITDTAKYLISNSIQSFYNFADSNWLYHESLISTDRSKYVKLYGCCVIVDKLNPKLYGAISQALAKAANGSDSMDNVLKIYLQIVSNGSYSSNDISIRLSSIPQSYFKYLEFDTLIKTAGNVLPAVWLGFITGKSVIIYNQDAMLLQSIVLPLYTLIYPGKRVLYPLVMDSSPTLVRESLEKELSVILTTDLSLLSKKFDLIIDLSTKTGKYSSAFQSEMEEFATFYNAFYSLIYESKNPVRLDDISSFNEEIKVVCNAFKEKSQTNMSSEKRSFLMRIVKSGVFNSK